MINFQFREITTIVIISFVLRKSSSIDISKFKSTFEQNRFIYQKEVDDVISYIVVKFKIIYDNRHQLLKLRFDDKTFLQLHHEYNLFNKSNVKLFNQRCESFLIKRRIDKLVYEFDLSFR